MIIPLSIIAMMACGKTGVDNPAEPTEEDAIFNIIRYDETQAFGIDMMDTTTGDTTLLLGEPYVVRHFWRKILRDSMFIYIALDDPADSLGAVPSADVVVRKFIWGRLEVMGIDTTGGGSIPVRFSKPFLSGGEIDAVFERVGSSGDRRRGWQLSRISDTSIGWRTTYIRTIEIVPENNPDTILYPFSYPPPGLPYSVLGRDQLYTYAPSESVSIRVHTEDNYPFCYVTLKYPTDSGFGFQRLNPDSSGEYITGFRMPNLRGFGHFLIDVVSNDAVTTDSDSLNYNPAGADVLYKLPF